MLKQLQLSKVFRLLLPSDRIHASAGNKKDACAKNKDCTDHVEDGGTDTASSRKLNALGVLELII